MSLIKKDVKISVRINQDTYNLLFTQYVTMLNFNPTLKFSDFLRGIIYSYLSSASCEYGKK